MNVNKGTANDNKNDNFFRRFSVFYNTFRPTWPSSDNATKYRIRGRQLSTQNIINYFDKFLPRLLYLNALPTDGEIGRSTKFIKKRFFFVH